jgi:hypothetical protein
MYVDKDDKCPINVVAKKKKKNISLSIIEC